MSSRNAPQTRSDRPVRRVVDRQQRDLEALVAQRVERVQDGVMFDRRRDDVPAPAGQARATPKNRQVVGFGAAPGERDLFAANAERWRDAVARIVEPARARRPSAWSELGL